MTDDRTTLINEIRRQIDIAIKYGLQGSMSLGAAIKVKEMFHDLTRLLDKPETEKPERRTRRDNDDNRDQ